MWRAMCRRVACGTSAIWILCGLLLEEYRRFEPESGAAVAAAIEAVRC